MLGNLYKVAQNVDHPIATTRTSPTGTLVKRAVVFVVAESLAEEIEVVATVAVEVTIAFCYQMAYPLAVLQEPTKSHALLVSW